MMSRETEQATHHRSNQYATSWRTLRAIIVCCALTASTVAAQNTGASVRVLGPDVAMASTELVHIIEPDARLDRGWSSLYATALSDQGEVATAVIAQPGSMLISVYAPDGTPRWSRELPAALVPSIRFVGDTLAIVERDTENESELVLLNATTGATLRRYAVPTLEDELAYVLGRYNGAWYVQVQRSAAEYVARGLPYRTLRRMEEGSGLWEDVLTHTDSTPRVVLPDGLSAIPTPFAPAPSLSLSAVHGPLFSSGSDWDIHAVQRNGTLQPRWRLTPLSDTLSDFAYNRAVAEWIANPPMNMIVPAGTFEKAAELGRAAVGRTLGPIIAAGDGSVLVRRRDADSSASGAAKATVWDLVHPESPVIERLQLQASENVRNFAANRRLLMLQVAPDGVRSLVVMRVVEPR